MKIDYPKWFIGSFIVLSALTQVTKAQQRTFSVAIRLAQTLPPQRLQREGSGLPFEPERSRPRPGFAISYTHLHQPLGFRASLEVTPASFTLARSTPVLGRPGQYTIHLTPYYRNIALPVRLLYALSKPITYAPQQWQWWLSAGAQISWLAETGFRYRVSSSGNSSVRASFSAPIWFQSGLKPGFTAGVHLLRTPYKNRFAEVNLQWMCSLKGANPWHSSFTTNGQITRVETNSRTIHWILMDVVYHFSFRNKNKRLLRI